MSKFINDVDYLKWYTDTKRTMTPRCVDLSTFISEIHDTLTTIVQMRINAEHNDYLNQEEYIDFEDIMNKISTMDF